AVQRLLREVTLARRILPTLERCLRVLGGLRGADGLLRVVELLRERLRIAGLGRVGVGVLRLRQIGVGERRGAARGGESQHNGELDRSHGRASFHFPSFALRSAICVSRSLTLARLVCSVAFTFASSAAALASESCWRAAAGSPPLMRFCALARYFSAWASRSLEPAKFAAPAAFAASMAAVAAFSFGAGSMVEQATA